MQEVKRIGIFSLGKIFTIVGVFVGILFGIMLTIITMWIIIDFPLLINLDKTLWILTFTLFPLIFALIGFIVGIFIALIYNFTARLIGGVKIQLGFEEVTITPDNKASTLIDINGSL